FSFGEMLMYFRTYYSPRIDKAFAEGNRKKVIEYGEQLMSTMPDLVRHVENHLPLQSAEQKELVKFYGRAYGDLGNTYREDGQQQKADECYRLKEKLLHAAE
ncbi:MAG TPA: hypothetical protein VFV79_06140, partial [Saprospiraceae bacterium]|nr:hypothetical protein [Saprospiraceae bacterium]